MPYLATVVPVMIASPGDVHDLRVITRDAIHEWNYVHSDSSKAVLMPVGWETHSSPELGGTAQELINDRVLKDCDLLIGIFWTRLGTPTGAAASGTADEIQRHFAAGKPAMIFFSSAPVAPELLDPAQYAALKVFRAWCEANGLIETFQNAAEFQSKLRRHLQISLVKSPYLKKLLGAASTVGVVGTPPLAAIAPDPRTILVSELSPEAKILLSEAASDKSGAIFRITGRGGVFYQTNGKSLGSADDRRSSAKWEDALQILERLGLIVRRGLKAQIYEVTTPGYEIADVLANAA